MRTLMIGLLLALAAVATTVRAQEPANHRVITWNVWNGFAGGRSSEAGARWLAEQDADVVALQELVGISAAQLVELAARWGHPYAVTSKPGGYAVGLTASAPIEVIERRTDGLHHGYLHARVSGVDYVVVHLHPGSWEYRLRESWIIAELVARLTGDGRAVVVLGDFNAHSAADRARLATRAPLLARRAQGDGGNRKGDGFDHEVMANIIGGGLIDLSALKGERPADETFPTRVLDHVRTREAQAGFLERIDYILTDPRTAALLERIDVPEDAVLDEVSDHYPVIARFRAAPAPRAPAARPNVLVILADDLGFSDIGCYGSEIPTPHLDRLARGGLRFTQVTNTSKCSPSRACLLTGAYAQAVGMDRQPVAIEHAVTLAEVLRGAGYRTYMAGKHHGTQSPRSLGFERTFALRDGACNYFNPGTAREGEAAPAQKRAKRVWCFDDRTVAPYTPDDPNFYTTNAFTDAALTYLDDAAQHDEPFFLYVAYNAPHDPLQAPDEDIERHAGIYDAGYASIRAARLEKQRSLGLFPKGLVASRAEHGPWEELPGAERADQARRMQVYAAMIDRLDRNIGRLVERLDEQGRLASTLILFASDNGASAENVQIGSGEIGAIDRWSSLQRRWANVSNTPFRKFKNHSLEGGLRTPFIAHWPEGLEGAGAFVRDPAHLVDVMPTLIEVAGARYPARGPERDLIPLTAGVSLVPLLQGAPFVRPRPLFYEWWKGRAIRDGRWKLVQQGDGPWQLFDLGVDRVEEHDLAEDEPARCARMLAAWQAWRHDPAFLGL